MVLFPRTWPRVKSSSPGLWRVPLRRLPRSQQWGRGLQPPLCACCSQGKVSPHSAGPVTGSLCWGSHLSRGSQLSCDRETKNRERGQWRLYSHTVFPASGREIHHKPRKNEATNSWEVLLPSSRCGKAGDYMAELKTKVILLKSHLRGQEELILCNLLI